MSLESPLEPVDLDSGGCAGLCFPHSTIEHFTPKRGYVTLTGKVDPTPEYAIEALAVMPFVWRFAPVHGTDEDHGWRRASRHDHYGLDEHGQWTVTDVRPGVQYAVVVVEGEYFKQPGHPDRMLDVLADTLIDDGGTLPRIGLGLPEFTHRKYDIHIGSAPDDHLTGAVLGVGRATWDEPGADGRRGRDPLSAWRHGPPNPAEHVFHRRERLRTKRLLDVRRPRSNR